MRKYRDERVFFITAFNLIAEYDVRQGFKQRTFDFNKQSSIESICVLDDCLYALTINGEIFAYCLTTNQTIKCAKIDRLEYKYSTIYGLNNVLIVAGFNQHGNKNILIMLDCESLSSISDSEIGEARYPIHQILSFDLFSLPNVAVLYKD